ncbi:unnamed protein product, partial [Rotaria socialis]
RSIPIGTSIRKHKKINTTKIVYEKIPRKCLLQVKPIMSDEFHNAMGPVKDVTPEIQKLSENPEVIFSAIDALYRKHNEHKVHCFTEDHREKHIANWRVTKYAEEKVAYGINYFLKVSIGEGFFLHMRVHRHPTQEKFHFYALHEIIKHNIATCVFTEDDPLTYFNH